MKSLIFVYILYYGYAVGLLLDFSSLKDGISAFRILGSDAIEGLDISIGGLNTKFGLLLALVLANFYSVNSVDFSTVNYKVYNPSGTKSWGYFSFVSLSVA